MTTKSAALHHAPQHSLQKPAWLRWLVARRGIIDIVLSILVGLAVLSVIIQFLYPTDRALPFVKIGGLDVGGKESSAVIAELSNYAETGEVIIKTPSKEWRDKWQTIGVNVDREASTSAVIQYEWWERAIPFSSVMRIWQSRDMPMIALVDDERLSAFAEKIVAEDKLAAQDATIRISEGRAWVDSGKNGYAYKVDEVKRQIRAATVTNYSAVTLVPDHIASVRSEQELSQTKSEVDHILAQSATLKVGDSVFKPTTTEVGSWIDFSEDHEKRLVVQFRPEEIKKYLEGINKQVATEPGTATVTLVDGVEVSRTPAPSGRAIDFDKASALLQAALIGPEPNPTVALAIVDVPPKTNIVRNYSQTNDGLMAIVRDWEASTYGDFGVVIREIGGQNRYAEWQPDKKFVTSSTFKMFLAYVVLTKIERGEVQFGQKTDMGWTVDACIKEMIINSTNPCAISLFNLVGWEMAAKMVQEAGFTATTLNNQHGGEKYTTVRDETNFLLRLHSGTLMGQGSTEYLLGLMKRQIWRGGIPAGVPRGTVVANKVGFYNGWVHDVAIVYGPKTTYILGIMSKGGSDPGFANLSRRVYNFFKN